MEETKQAIRGRMLRLRASLSAAQRAEADAQMFSRLLESPLVRGAGSVFCYLSVRDETDTVPFLREVIRTGRILLLPRCGKGGRMEACRVADRDGLERVISGMASVFCGIPQPDDDAEVLDHPDLCVVPCLAFDDTGARIGYGGGYYDRYLAAHPSMASVLAARSCQRIGHVPDDPWDRKADWILTEEGLKRARRNAEGK